jgi:signal transduction histidine kinase
MMDGEQIKQALLNLVINGLQAMSAGGQLEMATARHDRAVTISVRDHGPGIAPEVRDRVFNPFVTTKAGGTGLGLAIAYRLVKQHNGAIQAADAPDGGSIFEIELPLEQKETVESPEAAPVSAAHPMSRSAI